MIDANGTTASGFESLREVFSEILGRHPEGGAALAIRQHGRTIVDLWGGAANSEAGRDWREDTPSVIFSATKGLMAILAAQLVQDGVLDYDAPVAEYWPEFAQNGKGDVRVREVISHRAGLPAFEDTVAIEDLLNWDLMAERLAAQTPLWVPGTQHAYHPLTFGWLIGEILHRVTGLEPGALLERNLAQPLQVDAWIGIDSATSARTAELLDPPELPPVSVDAPDWVVQTTMGGASFAQLGNSPVVRAAQIPAAGGVATAPALAKIWSSTVVETDGVRTLGRQVVELATRVQSEGPQADGSLPPHARWGMGFQLDSPARAYLTPASFGHDGFGGQVTFADPIHELSFAFISNRMLEMNDDRANSLIRELRRILGI
jgi:CubicO group peptidase (beta-lactamase class C family)